MSGKLIALLALGWAVSVPGTAQQYQKTPLGLRSTVNAVRVEVQFFSPSLVRVMKTPAGSAITARSLSVVKTPAKTSFDITGSGEDVRLKSENIVVSLNLKSGALSFSTPAGTPLLREKEAGTEFTPFNDAGVKTHTVRQSFVLAPDEPIYGLGQQQKGNLSQRGQRLEMFQGNLDDYIPFFVSVKGYGLFWDNTSPTVFTDTAGGTTFKSDVGEGVDYYFMAGANPDGVIAQMRDLTGQVPMFPLWTYGYWQSRERYKSQFETVDVVRRYRALGVPLDGIIQDWQYWGDNFHWNAMEFLNPAFPAPKKMVDSVHAMNAHIIISVWASFGPQTKQFEVMKNKGMLLGFKTWPPSSKDEWPPDPKFPSGVRCYDPFNPEARNIFWDYLNKGVFSLGFDGWWLDSSEPDHWQFIPSDFNDKTWLGSYRKVCNAFPLMHVGGVFNHQRAVTSDKRVFILTRSAFAGSQRNGANVWSGDVVASWEALRNQIPAALNVSLSGVPHWNSDIGGFFLWNYPKKLDDPCYRELFARWIQFGALCPMMRVHGTDAPKEIYQFGKKGDTIYDAIEKSINLRYALLPYIYAASWAVTSSQSTMMRALAMDFTSDKRALDVIDQYMFGKSLLVCPVTRLMYADTSIQGTDTTITANFRRTGTRSLYLPEGTGWVDFWSGETVKGGQTVAGKAPIDITPLYARAGTILPLGPAVQYATEKPWDSLEVRVYAGADGQFTLYEDENDNYNYEKGLFSTITFQWHDAARTLTIGARQGRFPGMLQNRTFNIVLVSPGQGTGISRSVRPDATVAYDGAGKSIVLR